MDISSKFPEILKDSDFKESFLGDIASVEKQLADAIQKASSSESGADKECMAEVMSAMHMLRGAAGAVEFDLVFHFAETIHRIAEVGLSFADNLQSDFLRIFVYVERAEKILKEIIECISSEVVKQPLASFNDLYKDISKDYGDYFYDEKETHATPENEVQLPETSEEEDLEDFLSSVGSIDEIEVDEDEVLDDEPNTEATQSVTSENEDNPYAFDSDEPADWEVLEYFYQESEENLAGLEDALLSIERNTNTAQATREIFRLTHTTKGAANSMGMYRIAKLMHELETIFERINEGLITLDASDYSTILKISDICKQILAETRSGKTDSIVTTNVSNFFASLEVIKSRELNAPEPVIQEETSTELKTPEVQAAPTSSLELAESENLSPEVLSTFRIDAAKIDTLMNTVGELIISRTRMSNKINELLNLCQELSKSRNRLKDTIETFSERFEYTNRELQTTRSGALPSAPENGGLELEEQFSTLEFDRYDDFNILSRQLSEIGNDADLAIRQILSSGKEVNRESSSLSGYISRIQDEIASTRLAPIVVLFKRLERSVRDAAFKEGHQVTLSTSGDDLLIDKSILDELYTPLLHIVRNSVAHGFTADSSNNQITINARQEGSRIQIEITDNGVGIDQQKVLNTALEQGFITSQETTASKALDLIFLPGFSTSQNVDEVSGRGIGLDAVKDSLQKMGGTISIDSEIDQGTSFILHLPLTLAIDRAMYFYVGDRMYSIFMGSIQQIYFEKSLNIEKLGEKEVVRLNDATIPLIDLNQLFQIPAADDIPNKAIVLCHYLDELIALKVDRVSYQDDIVVKGLGRLFEDHAFFSAATLYGDGEIVPIIDIGRVSRFVSGSFTDQIAVENQTKPQSETKKVLLVDDSLSVRKVCENHLLDTGVEVDTANDGIEALNQIQNNQYSLVITDLEMPRLNGLELIAELKRRESTANIPVVVITSRSTEKHQKKAISAGASKCIGKPFTKQTIHDVVTEYVSI